MLIRGWVEDEANTLIDLDAEIVQQDETLYDDVELPIPDTRASRSMASH